MQPLRKTKSVFGRETRRERKKIVRNEIIANVNKVGFTVTMTTRRPAAPLVILIFQTAAKRVKSHCKLHTAVNSTPTKRARTHTHTFVSIHLVCALVMLQFGRGDGDKKRENTFERKFKKNGNEKRYETFKMQIHAADEVYICICFAPNLRYHRNGTVFCSQHFQWWALSRSHSLRLSFFSLPSICMIYIFQFVSIFRHTHTQTQQKSLVNYAFG